MKVIGFLLFLLVLTLVFPSQNPYMVTAVNAVSEPTILREKDSILTDYGNGTFSRILGLPERVYDDSIGQWVDRIIHGNSTHWNVNSEHGSFSYNKSDCTRTFYHDGFDPITQTPTGNDILVGKWFWTVAHKPVGESWEVIDASQFGCNISTLTNSTGQYLTATRSHASGSELKVTISAIEDEPYEDFYWFTMNIGSWNGDKFAPVLWMKDVDTDSITLRNGTTISIPLGETYIDKSQLTVESLSFVKDNNPFFFDWLKAKSEFKTLYLNKTTDNLDIQFGFNDNPSVMNVGDTIFLDPSYSSSNPTEDGRVFDKNDGTDDVCDSASQDTTNNFGATVYDTGDAFNDCSRGYVEWDISLIPDSAIITNTVYKVGIWDAGTEDRNCDIMPITNQPSVSSASTKFTDIGDGTAYVSNSTLCQSTGDNKTWDLGTSADSDVESQLSSDWFAIGIKQSDETLDASEHHIQMSNSGSGGDGTPDSTLEITYTLPVITVEVNKADTATDLTTGSVIQTNSSTTRTISLNGTGHAVFTGLGGNQNFTTKETTHDIVVNKTLNYDVTADATLTINSNIFDVDCSDSGTGTDFSVMVNDTDGHHITNFATPICSASNVVTIPDIDFTANGNDATSFSSIFKIINLNTTHFGNAVNVKVDGSSVDTTLSTDVITSDSFSIGSGLVSKNNVDFVIPLKYIPDVPTGLSALAVSGTQITVDWDAPTNSGNGTISGYRIDYDQGCDDSYETYLADTGSSDTLHQVTGLSPTTCYNFKLKSINEAGSSNGFSDTAQATTLTGSGGGSSGGGSSGGSSGSTTQTVQNIASSVFSFDIFSKVPQLVAGEFLENQELKVEWESNSALEITGIQVADSSIIVTFAQVPFVVSKDNPVILYNVQSPPVYCKAEVQSPSNCVEQRLYEIPVTITGSVPEGTVSSTHVIKLDYNNEVEIPFIMILVIIGSAILIFTAKAIRNRTKGSKSSGSTKRSSGKTKNGTARASISRR